MKRIQFTIISLIILSIIILPQSLTVTKGFITATLPSNVIFADDFENYPANQKVGCSNTQGYPDGWGWIDCDTGGVSNITTTAYYSCCHSLATQSPNLASNVFDVDKKFGLPSNSTVLLQLSIWFTVSESAMNEINNDPHISLETWNKGNRYEAPVFYYTHTQAQASTCKDGMLIDAIGAPTNAFVGVDHTFGIQTGGTATFTLGAPGYSAFCLPSYNKNSGIRGIWHHELQTVNVRTLQWVGLVVDGWDFSSLVNGLYFSNHGGGGDLECGTGGGYSPCGDFWRFEIGNANSVTHTLPTDTWTEWHDDVIISDVTTGQPPNLVQFSTIGGLLAFLALLGIVMIWIMLRPSMNWLNLKPSKYGLSRGGRSGGFTIKEIEEQHRQGVKAIIIILIITFIVAMFAFLYGSLG